MSTHAVVLTSPLMASCMSEQPREIIMSGRMRMWMVWDGLDAKWHTHACVPRNSRDRDTTISVLSESRAT